MPVHSVCRSTKLTLLKDILVDVGIPNIGQLFCAQIEQDWGHKVSGLVLNYDQNVLIECPRYGGGFAAPFSKKES